MAGSAPELWIHLGPGARVPAVLRLAERIAETCPPGEIGLSVDPRIDPDLSDLPRGIGRGAALPAQPAPRVALIAGETPPIALLRAAKAAGTWLLLVEPQFEERQGLLSRLRTLRGQTPLRYADRIVVEDRGTAAVLRRNGIPPDRIEVAGRMEDGARAPRCAEAEREMLAELLGSRPVWAAVGLSPAELPALDHAQRAASRSSHRLLGIVVPADPEDGPACRDRLTEMGWAVGLRSAGDEPEPETQIYVADLPDEDGLWFRLAPVTFLGGSLIPPGQGRSPLGPAMLGSAILMGPHGVGHPEPTARLGAAGALRPVANGPELGAALTLLLSPDRAADLAARAWGVVSEGAEASDRVAQLILDRLGRKAA